MARRKTKSGPTIVGRHELGTDFAHATGTENENLQTEMINQIARAMWMPEQLTDDERLRRLGAALSMLKGIKPTNEIEGMLAAQMVATHSAAMECFRRAMHPNQTAHGQDQNLKHAAKLLSIYARQIEVLDKHRGKGQQKITVEHVNVEAGGQAIVGHVETGKNLASENQEPKAITSNPGQTIEMDVAAKVPAKKRRRLSD